MILYHWTLNENVDNILQSGLIPKRDGWCNYLTPKPQKLGFCDPTDYTLLQVETGDVKLTAFSDCKEWEVLCWGIIPPKHLEIYKGELV